VTIDPNLTADFDQKFTDSRAKLRAATKEIVDGYGVNTVAVSLLAALLAQRVAGEGEQAILGMGALLAWYAIDEHRRGAS
jgi:hypothetical protein